MTVADFKEEEVSGFIGLLALLCQQGQKLVCIDGRVFAVLEFNEANNSAHKHELRGRDITHLIREQQHVADSANVGTLVQKIEATAKVYRFWERSFPYRLFFPPGL